MYARSQAEHSGLDIEYRLQDLRAGDYGQGFGLALFISGEFNVFTTADISDILVRTNRALSPGGKLVLEVHTFDYVRELGHRDPN